jgi:zinc transport system substrate-binding protein
VKEIDPENSHIYKSNYKNYLNELSKTDLEIEKILTDLKINKMVTFHNAWQYFAKDYGLKIVKTFEPFPGKQPTAKYLLDLEQSIKKNDIEIIFSEPQLSVESLQAFLNDMDLELYVLDPLGGTGPDTNSYIKTMKKNAEVINEALDYESD